MKNGIFAVLVILLMTGCVKSKNDARPEPEPPVFGQLLSFTNNAALSGATVESSKCIKSDYLIGCVEWDKKTIVTPADGSFQIERDYFRNFRIDLPGYWSYINLPDYTSWGGSGINQSAPVQYIEKNGRLEKIIVKLLPIAKVNVHLKNTSAINDQVGISFTGAALHTNLISAELIYLRKGIDTIFEYTAFGSINNRFEVIADFYSSNPAIRTTLYSGVVFLNAGSSTLLDISF